MKQIPKIKERDGKNERKGERSDEIMKKTYILLVAFVLVLLMTGIPHALSYPPAGFDYMDPTTATIELEINGMFTETLTVKGPTNISRSEPYDPGDGRIKINTTIVSMNLVGTSAYIGHITIIESPTEISNGTIQQLSPGEDFPANSTFDVFVEIQTTLPPPNSTLHNDERVFMNTTIYSIPPWGALYIYPYLVTIPLKNEQNITIGYIKHVSHQIPPPPEPPVEINEIFGEPSATPEELYEWIEIINTGTSAVDVSGWKLTDGENNWIVPALTPSLSQWDTFVFDLAVHNDSVLVLAGSGGALEYSGSTEDYISLYDGTDTLIDQMKYYRAYTDENVVQIYDGEYDLWDAHYVLSKGYSNHVHSGSGVKINEVLAEHNATAGQVEFVEIYNTGSSAVDLTGWKLRSRYYTPYEMMGSIGAGEHLVLYKGTNQTFSMHNTYGTVAIHNENGQAVDLIQYNNNYNDDDAGYPRNHPYQIPSGPDEGVSWERIPAGEDTNKDVYDFKDNPDPSPCTLLYMIPGVGGEITPIDKLLMLMPWIGLAVSVAVAAVSVAVYRKKYRGF